MASASASSWYRCEEETAIRAALNNHDMALRQCRKAADLTGSNAQLNIMLHGGKGRGKRTTLKHALAARMRDKDKGKHDNDEETLCEVDVAQVDCRAYAKNGPRSLLAGVAAAMAGDVDMQMNGAAGTPLALVTAMRLKKQQQHSSSASASTGTMMMTTTTTTMTTMTTTTTTAWETRSSVRQTSKATAPCGWLRCCGTTSRRWHACTALMMPSGSVRGPPAPALRPRTPSVICSTRGCAIG